MIRGLEELTLRDTGVVTKHTSISRLSIDSVSTGHVSHADSSPTSDLSGPRPLSWSGGHVPNAMVANVQQPQSASEETDAFQFMIAGSLAQARCKPRQPAVMMKSSQIAQLECQQKSADYGLAAQQAATSPPSADSSTFTKPWLFAVQPPAANSMASALQASGGSYQADLWSQPGRNATATSVRGPSGDRLSGLHKGSSMDLPAGRIAACAGSVGPAASFAAAERTEKMLQLHHSYGGAQLRSPLYGQAGPIALSLSDGWKTATGRTSSGTGGMDGYSGSVPVHFDTNTVQIADGQPIYRAHEGMEGQLNPTSAILVNNASVDRQSPVQPRTGTLADRQQSPQSSDDSGSRGHHWQPQRSPDAEFLGRQHARLSSSPATSSVHLSSASVPGWPAAPSDGSVASPAQHAAHGAAGADFPVGRRELNEQHQLLLEQQQQQQQLATAVDLQNVTGSVMHVARLVRIGSDGSINSKDAGDSEMAHDSTDATQRCEPDTTELSPLPSVAAPASHATAGKGAEITCQNSVQKSMRAGSNGNYENMLRASTFAKLVSASDYFEEAVGLKDTTDDGLYAPSTTSRRSHKRTMSAGAALAHLHQRPQLHRAVTQCDSGADSLAPSELAMHARTGASIAAAHGLHSGPTAASPTAGTPGGRTVEVGGTGTSAPVRAQSTIEQAVRVSLGQRPSLDSSAAAAASAAKGRIEMGAAAFDDSYSIGNRHERRLPQAASTSPASRLSSGVGTTAVQSPTSEHSGDGEEPAAAAPGFCSRRHTFSESNQRPLPMARAGSTSGVTPESPSSVDSTAKGHHTMPEVVSARLSSRKLPVAEVSPFTMTSYASLHTTTEQRAPSSEELLAPEDGSSSTGSCSGPSISLSANHSSAQVKTAIANDEDSVHPSLRPPRKYSLPPPSSDDGSGDEMPVKGRVRDYENIRSRNIGDSENFSGPKVGQSVFGQTGDINDSTYRGQLRRASEYQYRRSPGSSSASPPMPVLKPIQTSAVAATSTSQSEMADAKMDPTAAGTTEATKPQPRPRHDVELRPVPPPKPPVPKSIYRWCSSSNLQRKSTSEDNPSTVATTVSVQGRSQVNKEDPSTIDTAASRAAPPVFPEADVVLDQNVATAPAATTKRVREPVPAPRLSIAASAVAAPPLPERRVHAKVAEITFPPPPPESPQDDDLSSGGGGAASSRLDKRASSGAMAGALAAHVTHARSGSLNSADCEVAAVLMASTGPLSTGSSSAFKPITGDASPHQSSPSANSVSRPRSGSQVYELGPSASPDSNAAAAAAKPVGPSLHAMPVANRKGADGADVAPARLKPRWPSPATNGTVLANFAAADNHHQNALGSDGMMEEAAAGSSDVGRQDLLAELRQQLEELRTERKRCEADALANNTVGVELTAIVSDRCGERQAAKYSAFVEDSEKVTRLLLRLARRLSKVEGEASAVGLQSLGGGAMRPGTSLSSPAELRAAETRREQLQMQHDDACMLRDGIERQRVAIEQTVLGPTLDAAQLERHCGFISVKLRLVGELVEIDDRISSCEERLAALERGGGCNATARATS